MWYMKVILKPVSFTHDCASEGMREARRNSNNMIYARRSHCSTIWIIIFPKDDGLCPTCTNFPSHSLVVIFSPNSTHILNMSTYFKCSQNLYKYKIHNINTTPPSSLHLFLLHRQLQKQLYFNNHKPIQSNIFTIAVMAKLHAIWHRI